MSSSQEICDLIEQSQAQERSGQIAVAIRTARQAEDAAQRLGNLDLQCQALLAQAQGYFRLGDYATTRQLCEQALGKLPAVSRDTALYGIRGDALRLLGVTALETGDITGGETYLHQVVALTREIGCDSLLMRALHDLSAGVYMPRGQFDLSLEIDAEALSLCRRLGLTTLIWAPLLTMTWVHLLSGHLDCVAERLAELEQVVVPGSLGEAWVYIIRVELSLAHGDLAQADGLLTRLFSLAEQLGVPEARFYARLERSRQRLLAGDAPAGLTWAAEALAIAREIHYSHLTGMALIERARAAWALGDLTAAESDLYASIEQLAPQGLDFDLSVAMLLLAALLRQNNRAEAAIVWREAAVRLVRGGFAHLAERERALSFPLIVEGLNSPDKSIAEASATLLEHLQRIPPPPLKIVTLGGWRVQVGGRDVEEQALRQRRAGELLGLLLISPGRSLTSDQVIDALWPERELASAQALFHHATSTLRRALEPDLPDRFPSRYLEVSDRQVLLRLPSSSAVDYEAFADHYRRGEWEAALACYGGEFLPEYRYADWAISPRQWLMQDYQRVLLEMAKTWMSENRYVEALDACRKVLAIEPWQEPAVLLSMYACLGLGNRPGALRLYRILEKALHDELGIGPQAELQALYRSLLKR